MLQPNFLEQDFLESIGQRVMEPEVFRFTTKEAPIDLSLYTSPKTSICRIGGINGMNTSLEQAMEHSAYLKQFMPGNEVEWVHNRSMRSSKTSIGVRLLFGEASW